MVRNWINLQFSENTKLCRACRIRNVWPVCQLSGVAAVSGGPGRVVDRQMEVREYTDTDCQALGVVGGNCTTYKVSCR